MKLEITQEIIETRNSVSLFWLMLLVFSVTVFAQLAYAGENIWTTQGLNEGQVTWVKIAPSDSSIVYSSTLSGLHRSSDGGVTWQVVNSSSLGGGGRNLFVSPTDSNLLMRASSSRAFVISENGGADWEVRTEGLPVEPGGFIDGSDFGAMAANGDYYYASRTGGLWVTSDAGGTWVAANAGLPQTASGGLDRTRILAIAPSDPSTMIVDLSENGIYYTADGGTTWQPTSVDTEFAQAPTQIAIDPFDKNHAILVAGSVTFSTSSPIYQTFDGGSTWSEISSFPHSAGTAVAFDHSTQGRVFVGYGQLQAGEGITRSDDGGLTWTSEPPFSSSDGGAVTVIETSTNSDGIVMFASQLGVNKRTNAQTEWQLNNTGLLNGVGRERTFEVSPEVSGLVYAATIDNLHVSNDGAKSWQRAGEIDTGSIFGRRIRTGSIDPSVPSSMYIVTQFNDVLRYSPDSNGGAWQFIGTPPLSLPTEILVVPGSPNTVYVSDQSNRLARKQENGGSWELLDTGATDTIVDMAYMPGNPDVIIAGYRDTLIRTQDAGDTWTEVLSLSGGFFFPFFIRYDPFDSNHIIVSSDFGDTLVYRSLDGGLTFTEWTDTANAEFRQAGAFAFDRQYEGVLYQSGTLVEGPWRTLDAGQTWHEINARDNVALGELNWNSPRIEPDPVDSSLVYAGTAAGVAQYTLVRDLAATLSTDSTVVAQDELVNYVVEVVNQSEDTAGKLVATMTLPVTASVVTLGDDCVNELQTVTCLRTQLEGNGSWIIELVVSTLDLGPLVVETSVESLEREVSPADNVDSNASVVVVIADADNDSVADTVDNCVTTANPDQTDTDQDGYGNACDADFDNSCVVNFLDLVLFSNAFQSTDPLYDLNADGAVNFLDFVVVRDQFLQPPGSGNETGICSVN
ncbi:MAG: thrombospondin type 3 repeat-containing protein [Gammaproteobacteria bacterium]